MAEAAADVGQAARVAGAGLVLLTAASGGMAYLWTPLTPGYYDLDCRRLPRARLAASDDLDGGHRGCLGRAAERRRYVSRSSSPSGPPFPVPVLTIGRGTVGARPTRARAEALRQAVLGRSLGYPSCAARVPSLVCPSGLRSSRRHVDVSLADRRGESRVPVPGSGERGEHGRTPARVALIAAAAAVRRPPRGACCCVTCDATPRRGRGCSGPRCARRSCFPLVVGWQGGSTHGRVVIGVAFGAADRCSG